MVRIVRYLANECGCAVLCWRHERDGLQALSGLAAIEQAVTKDRYSMIYAMPSHGANRRVRKLGEIESHITTAKSEDSYWKRHEIVRIDSPMQIVWGTKTGRLYELQFANEYVLEEQVRAKSPRFRELTTALVDWLKREFVSWRGPDCFDNPLEHKRLFGDRFLAKRGR
jgi:hypothetical protein